jgi:hypothetical protein
MSFARTSLCALARRSKVSVTEGETVETVGVLRRTCPNRLKLGVNETRRLRWKHRSFFGLVIVASLAMCGGAELSYIIESKNFRVPDVGLSFNLPKEWTDLGKERIDTMNRLTQERSPSEKGRYVAGLERDLSYSHRNGYPTYLFLQKYPSRVSAKSLLAAFPKLRRQGLQEASAGDTYLDEKLHAIVAVSSGTGEDGPFITRTYTVPTKTNLVNIHTYCSRAAATNILPELEASMVSIRIDASLKLPDRWVDDLKSLMRERDAKVAATDRTNAPATPLKGIIIIGNSTNAVEAHPSEAKPQTVSAELTNSPPAAPPPTNTPAAPRKGIIIIGNSTNAVEAHPSEAKPQTISAEQTNSPPLAPPPTNTPATNAP